MKTCNISKSRNTEKPLVFRKKILDWYDVHRRVLPWRALPDETSNPYHVWLSEVMLQQTTVQAVIPYFLKFIEKWPDVDTLARAESDDVMSNWAGLGYYARARNLHKCAKAVSEDLRGVFPSDQAALKNLSGVGDYTSAAITSIAFGKPATVVDGNVERVMARYHACDTPLPKGKSLLKDYAHIYADGYENRTGDYAQGLMDLGATICTPKSPACTLCPLNSGCMGIKLGSPDQYPVRGPKLAKPKRYGYVYWVTNDKGEVLVQKRPEKGLLGGMYGLLTSDWDETPMSITHLEHLDITSCESHNVFIEHVFTHFNLRLDLYSADVACNVALPQSYVWMDLNRFDAFGIPTVFKKAVKLFR